jgi:PKD repeat protein
VIDKGGTASATVYKTLNDFINDLESGSRSDGGAANGPGVSGPVVVTFAANSGPYTEQVNISAITGASSTNTITINGNGETVQYTSSSSSSSYTIRLNGADYFIFDNLVVRALGSTYGRCFHLMNSADYNVIQNCELEMPNVGTSSYNAYVALSNGTTSLTSSLGDPGQQNVIKNNVTSASSGRGPYYGMGVWNSSSSSIVLKNRWEGNTINDFYYYGMYMYYTIDQTIIDNEISNAGNLRTGTKYGMYLYNYNKGMGHTIEGNYIHDLGTVSGTSYQYGIYLYAYYGNRSEDLNMVDNRIVLNHPYYAYGMYLYCYYSSISGAINIDGNYIEMVEGGTYTTYSYPLYMYGYYMSNVESVDIVNNEVFVTTDGGGYGMYNYLAYHGGDVLVANNKVNMRGAYYIYGMYNYGVYGTGSYKVNYNTINVTNKPGVSQGTGYTYMCFLYYLNNGEFKNNILYSDLTQTGYTYGIYEFDLGTAPQVDYNNIHLEDQSSGQTLYAYWGGTNYNTFNQFVAGPAGSNNVSINPKFADVGNNVLSPQSFQMVNLGTPIAGITTDYRGVTRSTTTPDMGAYEFYLDVSIESVDMVGSNECGGYTEGVKITLKNNNAIDISDIPLQYTINGGTPVKETITTTIQANSSISFTFAEVPEFNGTATHNIVVSLDGTDDLTSNNSASYSFGTIESPFGAMLSADANTFPGYYQLGAQGGVMTNPDVTVPGLEIEYDITNPTRFSGSNYDVTWELNPVHMTSGGVTVSTGITFTAPTGSADGTVAFDPDPSLADSLVYIGFAAHDVNTGCDSIFGRWVYIPHTPVPDFDYKDVCDGEVVAFTDQSTLEKGLIVYSWDFDDPSTGEDNTSEISDPVHLFSTYGSYDVTLTTTNFDYPKFEYTKTYTINVNPVPEIAFKVKNACEGVNIQFDNQTDLPGGLTGNIDYIWDFGDGSATTTVESPAHLYTNPGGYKVTLKADYNGCEATLVKNANQFDRPTADFTVDGNCNLEETQFNNMTEIEIGNTGYRWEFGDGDVSNLDNPTHAFANPGNHTVKLTAISEFGCEDEKEVTFSLNESPMADFNFSDPCNLSDIDFTRTGTIPAGNSIYEWDFDGMDISTQENPSFRFGDIGVHQVTLKVSSDNGCSDMITKDIVVKLQAEANFSANDVCEGDEVAFTNSSTVARGDLNYTWRFGDGSNSNLTSPRHSYTLADPNTSETFNVTLVANVLGGCADSITQPVTVNALSNASFVAETAGRDLSITSQETTNPAFIYNWRFGDGGRSSDVTPTYTYEVDKGEFEVCLAIINEANCLSESCETVTVDLLGVEDLNLNNNMVQVYPNPSTGIFNVDVENPAENLKLVVISITGEVVEVVEPSLINGTYTINLENAAEGVYLLQVRNGDSYAVKRITVAK